MKPIAIHDSSMGFHSRWMSYCEQEGIPYRVVNCYGSDLIKRLDDCSALMWHFSQSKAEDVLIAPSVMQSVTHAGIPMFPDYASSWHFDDKVAQKYLLEALNLPLVPAHVFLDPTACLKWLESTEFPKVFKLRRGAGSASVRIVKNVGHAKKLVRQAFGRGFSLYDPVVGLRDSFQKFRSGHGDLYSVVKASLRFGVAPLYSRVLGKEKGYVYFQDFLPDNSFDIRLIVIGKKLFGLKRFVRKGDFRASGSGDFEYLSEGFDPVCIGLAFDVARKLGSTCLSMDFIYDGDGQPKVLEVSFGFVNDPYDFAPGYWDSAMKWHAETPNPMGWIVESVVERVQGGPSIESGHSGTWSSKEVVL